jgi:imidazolonepropionase-like amidohydrolase
MRRSCRASSTHTHLTREIFERIATPLISVPREALIGVRTARVTLQAGFTTVRNLGAEGFSDVALREAIEDGDVVGPRMVVSGPALTITGGQCDNNRLPPEFRATAGGVADGIDAVRLRVRDNIKYGADVIKVCATGPSASAVGDGPGPQYTLEEMQAIVSEAHRLGRRVAIHAHGAEAIRWAAQAGADSVEHGTMIDKTGIDVLKSKAVYLVPTSYLREWNLTSPDAPRRARIAERALLDTEHKNVSRQLRTGSKSRSEPIQVRIRTASTADNSPR